jgi:hypothetical protein
MSMMKSKLLRYALVSVLGVSAAADVAWAGDAKKESKSAQKADDKGLSVALEPLKWGDTKTEVIEKLKAKEEAALLEDAKLRNDKILMQRARKEILDRSVELDKSHVRFNGEKSGYEVSVIAEEFTDRNGESMLRIKDKVAQRFYMFVDGQLYKMVVAYNKDYLQDVGFEAFAAQTARKYGRPVATDYAEIFGEEELTQVTWEDPRTELRVENKREFFGTYVMVFSDRDRLKKMQASGKKFGGSDRKGKASEEVSSEVAALTAETKGKSRENAANDIIGDVKIDLNEGRPKDEQLRPSEAGGQDSGSAADSDKGKKTKKPKTKKPKTKKPKTKRDFGDLDAKGGDELIIY